MTDENLKKMIFDILRKDNRLWNKEKTELNQSLLMDLVDNLDNQILRILLENDLTKDKFFINVDQSLIFKPEEFKFFLEENKVKNSFTHYKNRIGLSDGKRFIKSIDNVVLNFPYKDCVLQGGQSDVEGEDTYFEYDKKITATDKRNGYKANSYNARKAKREEVFFNQILAQDEIDRLFDNKAFVNWKRFNQDGEQNLEGIERNDKGVIEENLIIQGNNLLALHSLKDQFAGKIKMIYIDLPFNTGSDSFAYNDNFNNSTWLTFIKNRVEIAKELLSDDGFMFVHTSYHMYPYLKLLLDEIFHNNYICTLNVLVRHLDRILKADKDFHDVIEYISIYTKDKKSNKISKRKVDNDIEDYIYLINEKTEGTEVTLEKDGESVNVTYFTPDQYEEIQSKPEKKQLKRISIRGSLKEGNSSGRFYMKYLDELKSDLPSGTLFKVDGIGNDIYDYRYFHLPYEGNKNGGYYQGVPVDFKDYKFKPYPNFFDFVDEYNNVGYEGNVQLRNGKKPEALISKLIDIAGVKEGEFIMDFFLGSGTTCAVAHKRGCRYIGIEQLDYGLNNPKERIKSVINGDQTGISKSVDWHGGGEFIYTELAKWNELAKEEINTCNNLEELKNLFNKLYNKYFLNYNVKIKEFKEKIIKESNFIKLPLERQKEMFLTMLDQNQMYVQKSEMEDSTYGISEKDQYITKVFYGEEN
ncbi:MAG: DNA methyltransferase [Candidatus Woesearchaeota archaeon]